LVNVFLLADPATEVGVAAIKRIYVDLVQGVARKDRNGRLTAWARRGPPYGWRRWTVSLLAIYDTRKMVDLDLPWWNLAATREVERFLERRPGARVFEYGAGASTAWLAQRAAEVVSVEHDSGFVASFREMLKPFNNVVLMECSIAQGRGSYVEAIRRAGGMFDLIVVDGRHRAACLGAALDQLKPDGIVLFDDSGRKRYREAIERCGLAETRHFGRSYCVPYPDSTSVISRRA
jgi:hypothetical protein